MILTTVPKDTLLTREGEEKSNLFLIKKGEVLVFINKKSAIIPLGKLGPGDYLGELSFFDQKPRSAYSLSLSNVEVEVYEKDELSKEIPAWLKEFGSSLARKIRDNDRRLEEAQFRPRPIGEEVSLSQEEQGRIYRLISQPK